MKDQPKPCWLHQVVQPTVAPDGRSIINQKVYAPKDVAGKPDLTGQRAGNVQRFGRCEILNADRRENRRADRVYSHRIG